MSLETRLRNLELQVLKGSSFVRGMKIMEQIIEANDTNNREATPSLLIKLYENGSKTLI